MFLKKIRLVNFKNFSEAELVFSPKINVLVGKNGVGKTNMLDAIHYLALTKSYLNYSDRQNIRFDQDFFTVEGVFQKDDREEVVFCGFERDRGKTLKKNGKTYQRLSDHIGNFPVVMISPYDLDLINEGSEGRRRFMDNIISQSDKEYLQNLMRYNRVLGQRNSLLKYFFQNHTFDPGALEVYDSELATQGEFIFRRRAELIEGLIPVFADYYKTISNGSEAVNLVYKSALSDSRLEEILRNNREKDRAAQYTTGGIHKDDLELEIVGYPIKKFGSQGQQKSYLIALKLAQLEMIEKSLKVTPILLLDDIFDKLDETRVAELVSLVNEERFGQIFISDAHPDRTEELIKKINSDSSIFRL